MNFILYLTEKLNKKDGSLIIYAHNLPSKEAYSFVKVLVSVELIGREKR